MELNRQGRSCNGRRKIRYKIYRSCHSESLCRICSVIYLTPYFKYLFFNKINCLDNFFINGKVLASSLQKFKKRKMPEYTGPSLSNYLLVLGFLALLFVGFYYIKKNRHIISKTINSKEE